ncbi:MAG: hypothetical protein ACJ744_07585 [Gaiellaceae bacterium]
MRARVVAFAGVLLAAGCGSGSSTQSTGVSGTLQALARAPGLKTVALTPGDGDFSPGQVRFSFLVVANDGRPVEKPQAVVWIARGFKKKPYGRATARLETIGVPGASDALDVPSIYVAHLRAPSPGTYWVLARPQGAAIAGLGNLVVRRRSYSPAVGARAPDAATPTLASTHENLRALTTSTHPDRALYARSVAQELAAHRPFVVAFATPKFCTSRTCGPVVDVVSHVRKQLSRSGVGFIHVEVYEHNDPSRGYNRWLRKWRLQSEPWVFLVGRDGRIKAKFEGSVSASELRAAVESLLVA